MQAKATREKELETILTICTVLVIIFFMSKHHYRIYLAISVLLGLVGMFSKYLTSKIHWLWMKLSEVMGMVSSKIILTIVFFVFLYPVAVLAKLFGNKDNLHLKKGNGTSYYIERNHKYVSADLENSW